MVLFAGFSTLVANPNYNIVQIFKNFAQETIQFLSIDPSFKRHAGISVRGLKSSNVTTVKTQSSALMKT